jgi:hypothetical protein
LAKNPLSERERFGIMRVASKEFGIFPGSGAFKIPYEVPKETA